MCDCKCKCKGATSTRGPKGNKGDTGANGTDGINAQQGYSFSWSKSNTTPNINNDGTLDNQGELARIIYRGKTYHGGVDPATIHFIANREFGNEEVVTLVLTDVTNSVVIGTKVITPTTPTIVSMNITGAIATGEAMWKLTCYSSGSNKCFLYSMDIKF